MHLCLSWKMQNRTRISALATISTQLNRLSTDLHDAHTFSFFPRSNFHPTGIPISCPRRALLLRTPGLLFPYTINLTVMREFYAQGRPNEAVLVNAHEASATITTLCVESSNYMTVRRAIACRPFDPTPFRSFLLAISR